MLSGVIAGAALMLAFVAMAIAGHLHTRVVALEQRMDAAGRALLEQGAGVTKVQAKADEMIALIQSFQKREGPTRRS